MSLPWMSQQVSVTTGQPLVGWVFARNARLVKFVLYCEDVTNTGHLLLEACEELDVNGNAIHAEVLELGTAIDAAPGTMRTYTIRTCPHGYVRLSAVADSPGFPATLVRGGIEVIW